MCTPSDFLREIVESAIFVLVYAPRKGSARYVRNCGTTNQGQEYKANLTKLNNRVYESKLLGYSYAIIRFVLGTCQNFEYLQGV